MIPPRWNAWGLGLRMGVQTKRGEDMCFRHHVADLKTLVNGHHMLHSASLRTKYVPSNVPGFHWTYSDISKERTSGGWSDWMAYNERRILTPMAPSVSMIFASPPS